MKKVVKAKSVNTSKAPDAEEVFAELCFYYPQYRMSQRHFLSHKYTMLLLKVARRKEAERMYNLTNIAAAPHTKKGQGVKKLLTHFKRLADG